MLWDGFDGKLTSSKWGKITKCSPDTALRDIQDLIEYYVKRKKADEALTMNWLYKSIAENNTVILRNICG